MLQYSQTFTRKQLAIWVESHTKYKYQELKNGVFFCKMLTMKFPEEASKIKYNPTPMSQYQCTNNLLVMKKILNRHGHQTNLNIHQVLKSKNNFDLVKWFKMFMDSNNQVQTTIINNFSSLPPKNNISAYHQKSAIFQQTPRKSFGVNFQQKEAFRIQSAQKAKRNSNSKIKRLSMAKSQAFFFKQKKPLKGELKIPLRRKQIQNNNEQSQKQMMYKTDMVIAKQFFGQNDDNEINQILYQRALQQSIQSFNKILNKITIVNNDFTIESYQQLKDKIRKSIFSI